MEAERHRIKINEAFYLSPSEAGDKYALAAHLNDEAVYNNTLKLPYPYTIDHAIKFLQYCEDQKVKFGKDMEWRIRDANGNAVGGVSLLGKYEVGSHKDEIGYWLARPHWGKGVMALALKEFCDYAFREYDLARLEANVFAHNAASKRVLEKAGFDYEGFVKRAYLKNGNYIDAYQYGLLR